MSQVFKVIDKRESDMAHTYNHFMMANDYEFLLFGGDLRESSDVTYLKEKQIPNYEFERHGNTVNWAEGWQRSDTDDVNNYVSKGAGANAVSENLAFYFSGRKVLNHVLFYLEDFGGLPNIGQGRKNDQIPV